MESKYITTFEEFKAKHPEIEGKPEGKISAKVEKYEDVMFQFILNLLM